MPRTTPPASKPSSPTSMKSSLALMPMKIRKLQPTTGSGASFYGFCDALEVKNSVSTPESGWGVDHVLSAWAKWLTPTNNTVDADVMNSTQLYWVLRGLSGEIKLTCIIRTDPVLDSAVLFRGSTLLKSCVVEFPDTFPMILIPNGDNINALYGGWGVNNERLFANGIRRGDGISVNLTAMSTDDKPIGLSNGIHCTDLAMALVAPYPTIIAVQDWFLDLTRLSVSVFCTERRPAYQEKYAYELR
ncbi:hypothetical protein EV421DRAFT_1739055 [Armillaria borealis]|uniref:Uncharacterized protein n=1 Tax=Armillaria borealis TaxID=47425 RepID=A0AA39J728_9AGAR|nr:hypothetical protein EV421DRAFT_1739055 [Armillaria borealis]